MDTVHDAVTRYAEAWKAGDLAAIRACYHPEFTLHYGGDNPLTGTHEGRDKALAVLAEVSRRTRRRLIAIVDVLAGEHYGAIVAREHFERDGEVAELERLLVYTVKDGQLHHCRIHDADQAVVDRFLRD